eukprot:3309008-Alexandrium_andersonii.AAC.1
MALGPTRRGPGSWHGPGLFRPCRPAPRGGTAGKAALAALAAWPPQVIAVVWKPLADWLEARSAAAA